MKIDLQHHLYLFLIIIGALAVSGNVSAEVQNSLPDSLSDPCPQYTHIDQGENSVFDFSIERLFAEETVGGTCTVDLESATDTPVNEAGLETVTPEAETGDAIVSGEHLEPVEADEKPVVTLNVPEALPFLFASEGASEKTEDEDETDSALFFMNIEKMTTDSPEFEDDTLIFAETDPVLIALEGGQEDTADDQQAGVEEETAAGESPDLMALETAVSVAPLAVPDIPVYTNKRINAFIQMYTRKKRDIFEQAIDRSGKYMKMIHRVFREYELPPNLAYLAVVESNFNPFARSRANAVGMWQFMSYTGKIFDLERSWWHDDRFDPEKSTVAAAQYLKKLHRTFDGDWELALAAYNSGGGTVRRAIRRAKRLGKPTDFWSLKLPRETRGYVPAFYAVVTVFSDLDSYGFKTKPVLLDEVSKKPLEVAGGISLKQVANALSIEHDVLSELNPCLRLRGLVPPTYESYEINIPGDLELSNQHFAKLEKLEADRLSNWKSHTVRQGETLWSISRYYKIPVEKILAFNHFKRRNLINIGQKLMLPVPANWEAPVVQSGAKLAKKALDKLPGVTYVHTVQKGDTLWKISNKYNVPISMIRYWNRNVLKRRLLKIGTEIVLKLPADYDASST
ncbi:transglycosylase SLT domain-containing protein [bacterium]|nr:transglycosylase SLT domain-containing protein [bacterium]